MPVMYDAKSFPKKAGVYLFKTEQGRVLYVGKATRINERVRSYFSSNPDRKMITELVAKSDEIEYIVTTSPKEALILERQLIKEHKPRFNSRLKDDKSYPYIILTDEEYPRIMYTRHPPKSIHKWGPFPNANAAKQVMQLLRKQFGIRDKDCRGKDGCLAMHIGLCRGPCLDPDGYDTIVNVVTEVLNGKAGTLIEKLTEKMDQYSSDLEYEKAAKQRDLIRAVRVTTSQHVVSSKVYRDCDAIGIASKGDLAAIVVLHADEGVVKGQEAWPIIHRGDIGETVSMFISSHYQNRCPPRLLLTPTPLFDGAKEWLNGRRQSIVEVRTPSRGDLVTLQNLATQNAEAQLSKFIDKASGSLEQKAANDGAEVLEMEKLNHIVCFDMAQLIGENRVGASVSFRNGRPEKKEYRRYTVKGEAIDDLRMMSEVVERWFKRQDEWPDLLLLDGGETHLNTIYRLLKDNDLHDQINLAAIAKKEETIFRLEKEPIILDRKGRVLVHARDEAHRFVNSFHRKQRNRNKINDPLQEVLGLGAKKMQTLLRHFGGRKGVEHASIKDLQTVPGIGNSLAERIFQSINP
ncbi:MAG: excinuclease ABC subunit UvrC [Euryarchaeota archaeon TMED248]|nr:hypothetical protein [Euryarchaeota archaeon]RPG74844.1 MAG: excinuclease ABC subunit UvrC [Euryarchaeota archaeon TMED248]|tara:strand:- start:388 stop:2115 length:1728 start_codon:yes stop_codon:yes gene_type:complete